ncbi:hypothetical protein OOZ15_04565 [Galbibacter sp. EGI 63066]|uniref:hypothetical protein n=1 Tax=Galbibacter sp. EGI 63066 TaxID=2993559 RepID=UPI002248CD39|nr:hypothetical protein [Galbibacter sp. EGI 63066]MCX2679206.1 hypothetical protein [Galbibacter sp. EGI 63066]
MQVFVFKTNVNHQKDVIRLQNPLNRLTQKNERWNFDLEDCDNIFRVETWNNSAAKFIQTLQQYGFSCEEL